MSYQAVLFDLDGTLLDTLADLGDSMNRVLRRAGFPEHPLEAYKYFVGDGMEKLALRALPEEGRDSANAARITTAMKEEYGRHWADKTRPYPGIPELLAELERMRIPAAVFSNKPDEFTRKMIAAFFPGRRFGAVIGARPGVPKKPDPGVPLEIAAALGISPSGFVYLGDTNTDMQTAVAAGMYPVGALWGFRTAAELEASGAKRLIANPREILEFFKKTT